MYLLLLHTIYVLPVFDFKRMLMSLFQIDSDFQKVILIQTRVGYINYAGFLFLLDSYFSNAPSSCQLFPRFLGITMLPTSPINVLSFLHYCSGNF